MKIKLLLFAALTFLAIFITRTQALADSSAVIDATKADSGVVTVTYSGDFSKKIKVLIKCGDNKYAYDIVNTKPVSFPLQMGGGQYTISVLRNTSGDSYAPFASQTVNISAPDDKALYTQSIQNVDFSPDMSAIKGFAALTKNDADLKSKLNDVYNYIVSNVSYDNSKASAVTAGKLPGYIPDIDDTYKTDLGICYDYSSLFAAALRSMGIPAKLEKGYCSEIISYYAWNEVLLNGKWLKIDTTYDASAKRYNIKFSQVKDNANYTVVQQY